MLRIRFLIITLVLASGMLLSDDSWAAPASADRWGLGVSTASTQWNPALSAWLELNRTDSAQFFTNLASSDPFLFTLGGIFRHTISGQNDAGLHVGGLLSLGTVTATSGAIGPGTAFAVNLGPVGGIHFALPRAREILFSFDAGGILSIEDGAVNFGIGGLSFLGGFSVHYFL